MSEQLPPNVTIFPNINYNSQFFSSNNAGLTYDEASTLFLKYPNAQGTENLQSVTIAQNKNIFMSSGTGILNQTISTDLTTANNLKKSGFFINSGSATGTGTAAIEVADYNGKGCYIMPNCGNGSLSSTNEANDCAITSRYPQNNNSLCFSNWNSAMRNGLRIFTTDANNCGISLQCGDTGAGNYADFKINYNKTLATVTTSFNYPINFNPNGTIVASKRALTGLGTLTFSEISGSTPANSTDCSITTTGTGTADTGLGGIIYKSGIATGCHQYVVTDNTGVTSTPFFVSSGLTSANNTLTIRSSVTPSNRLDIVTDSSQNTTIRGKSATASTSAIININCDSVNNAPTPVVTNNQVITFTPLYIEIKKPLYLNYSTQPSTASYLGYLTGPTAFATTSYASSTLERTFNNFTIPIAGLYNVTLLITLSGGANHTLTEWRYCIDGTSATFPSTSTPTKYTPSINGHIPVNLDTSTISYFSSSFNITATAGNIFYINFKMVFAGGGNTVMGCIYSYTRIG